MRHFPDILSDLAGPAHFFFLRHGESEGNVVGMMQGRRDAPLTERGREQVRKTAAWFGEQRIEIDAVLTSPLVRASETASIIAAANAYPEPVPSDPLTELYMGPFSGLTLHEIRERYPEEYAAFTVGSWEAVPGAEPVRSLTTRAIECWEALVHTANSGTPRVLSVSHGGMLQWIIKASFGATAESDTTWMPLIKTSNAAVSLFTARPAGDEWYYGQWSLVNFVPGETPEMGEQFYTSAR